MSAEIWAVVAGPVVTALLAGLGILLKEWRARRQWEHGRDEILDQGRKQVLFISDWITAYSNLVGDGQEEQSLQRARRDLDVVYERVSSQTEATAEQRPLRHGIRHYASIVFLTGVRRPWARVSRVFYFVFLGFAVFAGVIMMSLSLSPDDDLSFWAVLGTAVLVTLFYLVPVALLHILTRHLDRPAEATRAADDAAPAAALLHGSRG